MQQLFYSKNKTGNTTVEIFAENGRSDRKMNEKGHIFLKSNKQVKFLRHQNRKESLDYFTGIRHIVVKLEKNRISYISGLAYVNVSIAEQGRECRVRATYFLALQKWDVLSIALDFRK